MIRRHLPPFASLVAFDAVARHRSFTRAANELGVTQSAVSHQLRRLEEFFGVQLLKRLNPGIELSEDGARLEVELRSVLDAITGLESKLKSPSSRKVVRIAASPTLARWWLVAQLQSFRSYHADIDIDLRLLSSEAPGRDANVDLQILWVAPRDAGAGALQTPFVRESIFPVCAPSLLPDGKPLTDPADLLKLPLIQKGHSPVTEWSWPYWLDRLGLQDDTKPNGLILGDVGLCLSSAVAGEGVAIGRSLLVADPIRNGLLVPALACSPQVVSPKVYVVRWNAAAMAKSSVSALVTWLLQAAESTGPIIAPELTSHA